MKNGAALLCDTLSAHGITCVFGLPGTQNIPVFEALRRSALRVVVPTHELAASFMAIGYYRVSGRLAPLVTIPGPGFTYALTGLAEARQDSAAVVHLTGTPPAGPRPFQLQALDQAAIASTLVKGTLRAERAEDLPAVAARAIALALAGEPGPVLVELSAPALADAAPAPGGPPPREEPAPPDAAELAAIAAALAAARRPVLLAGQGCAGVPGPLRALAELLPAPVFTTASGRGTLPEDHALSLGFDLERGGAAIVNELLAGSDCVLALGCKLSAAGTGGWALRLPPEHLVQIDASEAVLGATYPGRRALAAPLEGTLDALVEAVRGQGAPASCWTADEVARWRARLRPAEGWVEPAFHGVASGSAAGFFAALRRVLPRDAVVVTDSGLHQVLARRHLDVLAPRGLLFPSDFQSMGFGLPAAIGAKLAAPDRTVVAVVGDGGFLMTGMELLTAAREGIAVTVVVFADGELNRIRLQQLAQLGHASGCEILNPDFAAFADAVGVGYERCEGDVEAALGRATSAGGPALVEVRLGDSAAVHLDRAKGMARGVIHRTLGKGTSRRLKGWLGRR